MSGGNAGRLALPSLLEILGISGCDGALSGSAIALTSSGAVFRTSVDEF